MQFAKMTKILAVVAMLAAASAHAADWSIIDLGTLGGTTSHATGINNRGQVAGTSALKGDLHSHAFLYSQGRMIDLGTLGGLASSATGINAQGEVVGESTLGGSGNIRRAFLYSHGRMTDIGTLGGQNSSASGINNKGQIVGWSNTYPPDYSCFAAAAGDCSRRAFLYSNGRMKDLGTLGSGLYSEASGINNAGQVVGSSDTTIVSGPPRGPQGAHSFLYSGGKMTDLGTLGGIDSHARGINEAGDIVGWSNTFPPDLSCGAFTSDCGTSRAYLYSKGSMTDLGTLGGLRSAAAAINNQGHVVGSSTISGSNGRSFFLLKKGSMTDLNALPEVQAAGWTLSSVTAINEIGQIVGSGIIKGQIHAFLLSPLNAGSGGHAEDSGVMISPFGR